MPDKKKPGLSVSRREFIKGFGTSAVATATSGAQSLAGELEKVNRERVLGPGAESITFMINGESASIDVQPNETLLDVLREGRSLTGAKEVCGMATCGACTVLIDGTPVYACMYLAVEAEGKDIRTVEGLATNDALSPLQEAFVEEDGMMCGYCTSGFLVTLSELLDRNPTPSEDEIKHAVSGHLCRCGTYPRIVLSALRASGNLKQSSTEVISLSHAEKLA